jgi:hypothetical protein
MPLDIAVVAVLIACAYQLGALRGRRREARWWTGAIFAAGRGKLDYLQAYIAGRNPRSREPHQCPEELALHLVLPHVGDRGKPIVLPADWAAAVGESLPKPATRSGTAATDASRAPTGDAVTLAGAIHKREKAS